MRHSDTLHSRNKLLVYIIWTMLALGIAVDFLTNATTEAIIVLLEVGGLACAVATVFTFKRWLQNYIMYIISGIISVLTLFLIVTGPLWTTYLLVYVNLAVMTLYGSSRPWRFSALSGAAMTAYLLMSPYKTALFGNQDVFSFMLYLVLISAPLYASARFSERLQAQVFAQSDKAIQEQIVRKRFWIGCPILWVRSTTSAPISKRILRQTCSISGDVSVSFGEIASSMESQTVNVTDISSVMQDSREAVASLAGLSTEMRGRSATRHSSLMRAETGLRRFSSGWSKPIDDSLYRSLDGAA